MGWKNHLICENCWNKRHPEGRVPVKVKGDEVDTCCYCGEGTASGIYVRDHTNNTPHCKEKE